MAGRRRVHDGGVLGQGELLWTYEADAENGSEDSSGFPSLVGDRVHLFGPQDVTVFADNGDVRWRFPRRAISAAPIGDRVLLVGRDDVWIIDPPG